MREIKFRALFNGRWYYCTLEECLNIDHESYTDNDWGFYKGDYKTQYTGLKDKNGKGKEVYHKDLFNTDKGIGTVEWSDESGWIVKFKTYDIQLSYFLRNDESRETIGTIYENPELLNQ